MSLDWIFLDHKGRTRSGWRAIFFVAMFLLAAVFIGSTIVLIGRYLEFDLSRPGGAMAATSSASLAAAVFAGWLSGKLLEGLPYRALGLSLVSGWIRNLLAGIALGAATLSLAVLVAMSFGGMSFARSDADGFSVAQTAVTSLLIFAVAAAFEEVAFRGYLMQTFFRSRLTTFGIIFTSLLFATVHNGNPEASWLSWLNTFLAGIWFAVAYLKTQSLWLPIGLHLSWNWVQGALFGIEVSGLTELAPAPLLRESDQGPAWLTGGNYGVEAGVACTVALLVSTVAVFVIPGIRPPEERLEPADSPREQLKPSVS